MLPLPALLALLVQVPAPTQEAPEQDLPPSVFRAGRNLPAERTLIYVECAGFDVLVRNAKAITQVRALGDEECGAFLRYFALDDDVGQVFTWRPNRRDSRRALAARHADLANILSAFDLGFGAAFLFDDGERPRPRGLAFFAAGKRGGDQLAARDLLRKVLEGKDRPADGPTADPRQFGVELVDDVLAGSPVRMTMAVVKPKQDEQGMVFGGGVGRRPFLAYAFGPGAAAAYIDEPYDDQEKVRARAELHLTQLMRLAHGETGVLLAPLEDLAEGEERLMAGALRWGPSVRLPGAVRDKDKTEMTQAGVGGFEGVQGELIATTGGVREAYRLLDKSGEGGLFTMFQPAGASSPRVAAFAPKDAIAFLNIGVDGGLFEAWCNGLSNLVPTRWFDPAGWMRALLGMKPGDGASLAGLTELTVMILPPSPGVPFPEPVLLFRLLARTASARPCSSTTPSSSSTACRSRPSPGSARSARAIARSTTCRSRTSWRPPASTASTRSTSSRGRWAGASSRSCAGATTSSSAATRARCAGSTTRSAPRARCSTTRSSRPRSRARATRTGSSRCGSTPGRSSRRTTRPSSCSARS
ncbi:MAG: hypothetical protein R3F30_00935 [Planctomycetota bacterium]